MTEFKWKPIPRREIIRMQPTASERAMLAASYRRMRRDNPKLTRLLALRVLKAERELAADAHNLFFGPNAS